MALCYGKILIPLSVVSVFIVRKATPQGWFFVKEMLKFLTRIYLVPYVCLKFNH